MAETETITKQATENAAQNKYINQELKDFVQLLFGKWKLFLIVGVLSGAAGFFYAYTQKPTFESRLTFALDAGSNDGGLSGAMNLAAQFGLGLGSGQNMFDGDNILQIMKSRRIIEDVLLSSDTFYGKQYTMVEYYLEMTDKRATLNKNPYLKNIHFPAGMKKTDFTYQQDSLLNWVFLQISTAYISAERPDKKLSIYEVKIKSPIEKFTKDFTDRIVAATGYFYTEITSKKDRETLEILEKRVSALKGNVSSSIDTKASTQDANVNPAYTAAQSPVLKEQYNMQAYGEAYKEMFKTLEMARYQYLKKIPLLQIIDSANYPMKKIKESKIKSAILFSGVAFFILSLLIWITSLLKRKP